GQAKLSTTSREGKKFILRIAKAGEILGLQATLTGKRYELTIETMQACQLDFVSRGNFLRFLKTHGDACLQAAQHVSRDYHEACDVPALSDYRALFRSGLPSSCWNLQRR